MALRVLVVHAHPADETVWTGATIARLVRDGDYVTVVTATRGERRAPLPGRAVLGEDEAGESRSAELGDAMRTLGVSDHRFLGSYRARWGAAAPRRYRDSGPTGADAGPDALVSADPAEVASDIAAVISDVAPAVVLSYAPDGADGDPDRRRVHEAARWAARVLEVPFYETVTGPGGGASVVDDDASLAARARALACYPGTIDLTGDVIVGAGIPRALDAPERMRRSRPPVTGFASYGVLARIIACLFALLIGAVAGLVLTVAHQSSVRVGEVDVPWGLIVGLVVTAALLAGLRLVYATRLIVGSAALGLLGAVGVLSLSTGSGSVLVADDPAGWTWTIGVVLIAAVVLAWPRFESRPGGRMKSPAVKGADQP